MSGISMNRRTLLTAALVGGAAAAAGYAGVKHIEGKQAPHYTPDKVSSQPVVKAKDFSGVRPNIVLINCDDLGYGDLGCYGNKVIRTPNIDRLAGEGARFTQFNACSSVSTPSRFGLLTGRYPVRVGMFYVLYESRMSLARKVDLTLWHWLGRLGAVDAQARSSVNGLPDEEVTLASALKVAGYRTGMVGKWHLGDFSREPRYNPCRHGFDSFLGLPHSNDLYPCALYRNETKLEDDIGLNQARLTGMYTREALDFIRKSKDKPFFLYFAHTFPHQPLFASEGFKDKSKAGIFGDAVEEVDWSVGEVLSCLKENGLDGTTIVIFTSDNGPWFNGSPGGLRGRKGQSYEGGYRVPFIVRWPGRVPAGSVCDEAAINIDLFPTLLPLAGLDLPSDRVIDGKSILGLLTGKGAKAPHDTMYLYHSQEFEGVRVGHWKYLRETNHYTWPRPIDKRTTLLGSQDRGNLGEWPNLYDLTCDRDESYNVAKRYPEVCAQMEQVMKKWEADLARNPGGWLDQ